MIYFVWADGTDRVKVGFTGDLPKRLSSIASSSPFPVKLLGTMPGGRKRERQLHAILGAARVHREWFVTCPALIELVSRAQPTAEGAVWYLRQTDPQFARDFESWRGTWRERAMALLIKAHS